MKTKVFFLSLACVLMIKTNIAWGMTNHAITISGNAFSNPEITINIGDKITWTNNDGMSHSVTEGSACPTGNGGFDVTVTAGNSAELTFNTAGEFNYFCKFHCSMTGKITVLNNTTDILSTSIVVSAVKTFPNPFVSDTDIHIQLSHAGKVKVEVYDMYGHKLMALPEVDAPAGEEVFKVSGESLRDGIFICKVYFNGKPAASEYLVKKSKS